jgi:hypothetical protein
MTGPVHTDRHSMAAEMTFLLSLTNSFSESFRIKRDRAAQWQFLGILLMLEENSIVSYSDLLDCDELKKVIEPGKRSYNRFYWVKEFINGFGNDDGSLVDTVFSSANTATKRSRIQEFKLNSRFDRATREYLNWLVKHNWPQLQTKVERLTDAKCRQLFKELFQYQNAGYLPLWNRLITDLSKVAARNKWDRGTLPKVFPRGANWVVLFLFWRSYLLGEATSWDTIDINQKATDILRLVEPNETAACLRAFGEGSGYHFLRRTKIKARWRYSFNAKYQAPLSKYSKGVTTVRLGLQEMLRKALQ